MRKINTLKTWLSLEDTAKELSNTIDEPVTTTDVLQLIIDERLPAAWNMRGEEAVIVAPYIELFGDRINEDATREAHDYSGPPSYTRGPFLKRIDERIHLLKGVYRIELN